MSLTHDLNLLVSFFKPGKSFSKTSFHLKVDGAEKMTETWQMFCGLLAFLHLYLVSVL